MFRRMDIILPMNSQYSVLDHFTIQMHDALTRLGIHCRLLKIQHENPKAFYEELARDLPECTLCFNGLTSSSGEFLADFLKIPHIACLVDSPHYFLDLAKSTHSVLTCPDRFEANFFAPLFKNPIFFMPHAVEKSLLLEAPDEEKTYPVLMLASAISYKARKTRWHTRYPPHIVKTLKDAAHITLNDQTTSFIKAFAIAHEEHAKLNPNASFEGANSIALLTELEKYVKGEDRVKLIKGVKDAEVHVFGSADGQFDWDACLQGTPENVILHSEVPFPEAINLMKRAKILLNSTPFMKSGAHERIFSGIACGALVITAENNYLKQFFKDDESIVFYRHGHWDEINEKVNYYLSHEEERRRIVEKGRAITLNHHTWDHRAKELMSHFPKA
ncbi:putative uncharacterized protein [Parachlamydia acanthamoebae UV-7]|uniref:Spore protein YkvP/CgeB glycosyl transferase-like domain-containing protein n=4 Tax=Parachlamydia acanthamoebae TaxID=83552 RepID=F8KUV3_PARAV|nr:putative uncharacterized protein [Parachlamydia acanthamoebae UV-7]